MRNAFSILLLSILLLSASFTTQLFNLNDPLIDEVSAATSSTAAPAPTPKPVSAPAPKPEPQPVAVPATPLPQPALIYWSDIPSSWAKPEIDRAMMDGLVVESLAGKYNSFISREEFIQLMTRLYETSGSTLVSTLYDNPFKDTASESVLKAYSLGFVKGTGDGRFDPSGFLTRQEAALIMFREWQTQSPESDYTVVRPIAFEDGSHIASWAFNAVQYMHSAGILKGTTDNHIDSSGFLTREQAIVLILRNYEMRSKLFPDAITSATTDTVSSATVTDATSGATANSDDEEDEEDEEDIDD